MEETKWEKAIKGLQCCGFDHCDPKDCPYYVEKNNCETMLMRDALTLLKAQVPRMMTLEEVKEMKRLTICAVEQRSKVRTKTFNAEYGGIVTLGNHNFLDFGLYGDTNRFRATEAGYGYGWRCWTSKPTEEQMEAIPWE